MDLKNWHLFVLKIALFVWKKAMVGPMFKELTWPLQYKAKSCSDYVEEDGSSFLISLLCLASKHVEIFVYIKVKRERGREIGGIKNKSFCNRLTIV